MPLELGSALSIERETVEDPEIRIEALEAIYLIALQVKAMSFLEVTWINLEFHLLLVFLAVPPESQVIYSP